MRTRVIVALAVSVAMVCTTLCTGAAFAASENGTEDQFTISPASVSLNDEAVKGASKLTLHGADNTTTLTATDINVTTTPVATTAKKVTVIVPARSVLIMYSTSSSVTVKNGNTALLSRDSTSVSQNGQTVNIRTYQVNAGSYTAERTYGDGSMAFSYAPSAGAALQSGVRYVGGSFNDNETVYYSIQAPSNGIISATVVGEIGQYSMHKVQLFDASKRPLSQGWETMLSSNNRTTYFGVKKGTYYIGVIPYSSGHSSVYDVVGTFTKKPVDPAGTKKKKAKTIKLGKAKRGIMYIGEKKTYWYKLKLKKARKVKFKANQACGQGGERYGNLRYEIVYKLGTARNLGNDRWKLKKGTYYIKVSRTNNATGYYTVKVK